MTSEKEQELFVWLEAIAEDLRSGRCKDAVLQHLYKHTGEPFDLRLPSQDDLREWMASLLNLVEIAKRVYGIYPTAEEQLERLQRKFEKEGVQNGYTPNPKHAGKKETRETSLVAGLTMHRTREWLKKHPELQAQAIVNFVLPLAQMVVELNRCLQYRRELGSLGQPLDDSIAYLTECVSSRFQQCFGRELFEQQESSP